MSPSTRASSPRIDAQLGDALLEIGELVLDPLALEPGQPLEPEVEDRLRLDLRQLELALEPLARLVRVRRGADQRDDSIEVVERDQVALENVRPRLGLAELELRAAGDDLTLEVEVVLEHVPEGQRPRDTVDERDRVEAEGRLQRRVLVELVQRNLGDRVALQLDLDPHPRPVRVVGEVRDLRQHLVVDEVGDLLDHAGVAALLHAVGQLGDDDRGLAAAQLLDVGPRAHDDPAAAGAVGLADALPAQDDRSGREVGPLDVPRQTVDVDVRLVDERDDGVDDLAEVVRRDVRRHADRDAGGAVDEQVREACREHGRLAAGLVVVRLEVDGVGVDVAKQLGRNPGEARLGVPHGSRGIVVDVPEVALAVDERVAHRERLREPDERVVDRGVPVRVVRAHDVADDARGLLERPVWLHSRLVHPVEDAPVHRLQPVPHVRQGARDDHAHRVVEEAGTELLLQVARLDAAGAERLEIRHRGSGRPLRSAR